MVFDETLLEYDKSVEEAVTELFKLAESNQVNDNDILLVVINGWKNSEYEKPLRSKMYSPFMIGPGIFGHCFQSLYEFYDFYRRGINNKSQITTEERETEKFRLQEKLSIDVELMIYLKFWEADLILFKLYNLVQLAQGLPYDWNLHNGLIGQRRKLIKDHVQNPLKNLCPKLSLLIDETYSNQIRNAIAHSKYFHAGRTLILGNKSENEHYVLSSIDYHEWEIRFHKILLIFNYLIKNQIEISNKYIDKLKDKHWGFQLQYQRKTI